MIDYIMQLEQTETFMNIVKLYFINLYTYYMNFKIMNISTHKNYREKLGIFFIMLLVTIICDYIRVKLNFSYFIISMIFFIAIIFLIKSSSGIGHSLIVTMISLAINYTILILSGVFWFFIFFNFNIQNDYINIIISLLIYTILILNFSKIRRFRKGFAFLQSKLKSEYFDVIMLNISVVVLYTVINIGNYEKSISVNFIFGLAIFAIMMFVTIQKSLQLYYKQKMLVKDLEETKVELEDKKKEVAELEKENLEFSKVSHSIAHKQKALEYKLNELSMKSEIADEIDIKDRIENLSAGLSKKQVVVLDKTGISEIDDMLAFMQSECVKNKIDFQLQLSGNIYTC